MVHNIEYMKTKRIFILIAAAALTLSVSAQQGEANSSDVQTGSLSMYDNYIGITLGGGMNTLLYKALDGKQQIGGGLDVGLFYSRFFNRTVGLGVGLNYSWANAYTLYNFGETGEGVTHAGNPYLSYNLHSQFNNWKERQDIGVLSIPVEVLFRQPLSDRWLLVGGVGMSVDFPLHGAYSPRGGNYETAGIFPKLGTYLIHDLPEHGFSTYDNTKGAKVVNRSAVGGSVLADLGFRVALKEHWGLYMGINISYGFTNLLAEAKTGNLVTVNSQDPSQIDYHGTFDSKETGKANLLRAGVKVAIDFGWDDPSKKRAAEAARTAALAAAEAAERARQDSIAAAEQAKADSIAAALAAAQAAEKARLDSIAAAEKAKADSIAAAEEEVRQSVRAGRAMLVVQFAAGKAVPEQTWYDELDKGIEFMQTYPDVHLHVTGCASMDGNYNYNVQLSKRRADFIYNYLLEHGISAERLHKEFTGPIKTKDPIEGRVAKCRYYYPEDER